MIKQRLYNLPTSSTINATTLTSSINSFWNDVFTSTIQNNHHLLLLCKVQFINKEHRTLAEMRKVNYGDKELFINFLISRLGILNDNYKDTAIINISFHYIVRDGLADDERALLNQQEYTVTKYSYNNMNIPLTIIPEEYGKVFLKSEQPDHTSYAIINGDKSILINQDDKSTSVHYQAPIDLKFNDYHMDNGVVKRVINKDNIYYKDGVVLVKEKELNAKPFKAVKVDGKIDNNNIFCTIDIETVNINGNHNPYLICGYINGQYIKSYATELTEEAQSAMFNNFIKQLLQFKGVKYVYAHNFSGFDGILLLKYLISYEGATVKPLIFNGKLMGIEFKYQDPNNPKNKVNLIFKDSFLLLPMSLSKLCGAFKVPTVKTFFPFLLSDIHYIGKFPGYELFPGLTQDEYTMIFHKHGNKLWSFKVEAIKYCNIDCKSLHEVITKFNELIFGEFKLNVHSSYTLPSLAMKIFKANFMPKDTLYQMLGKVEWDIRESYTGGAVDVYNNHKGFSKNLHHYNREQLYYYDVNSLYPFVMSTLEMPIGKPIAFEGDITTVDPEAYGFFYCEITCPDDIEHPILQRRIKTADGVRTIAGVGSWTGWVSSKEMETCLDLGYTFNIIRGYKFKKAVIFKEYVHRLYQIRLTYNKTNPLNLVAKLLMNSLYGKFGMKPEATEVKLYDQRDSSQMELLQILLECYGESVQDLIKVGNHYIMQDNRKCYKFNQKEDVYHGLDVNIAIASTITAGARSYMSQFKNIDGVKLYYSDTDSIIVNKPLSDASVGNKLGQVKLECTIKRGVFLAPKVYGLITTEGETIIKVKGLTKDAVKNVTVDDLESLLVRDSVLKYKQVKWSKDMFGGNIQLMSTIYQLRATSNKRLPVYKRHTLKGLTICDVLTTSVPFNYNDLEKGIHPDNVQVTSEYTVKINVRDDI